MANQPPSGSGASNSSARPDSASLSSALDLLGQMEGHVGSITNNRPSNVEATSAADAELTQLREELLSADQKGYEQLAAFVQALDDLKLAIPSLIDESVNTRFLELEESFHGKMKEIHSRSIDAFTQSVQSKIGQRISALEANLSIHTETMGQLREHYLKTDRNVQRLMSGLDRLTAELFRLSTNASPNIPRTIFSAPSVRHDRTDRRGQQAQAAGSGMESEDSMPEFDEQGTDTRRVRKRKSRRRSPFIVPLLVAVVVIPIALVGWSIRSSGVISFLRPKEAKVTDAPLTGIAAQMKMAADFATEKNYPKAESTYRLILKSEPENREAIKELASVLFRQQRYEEAAAVLKSLPPE